MRVMAVLQAQITGSDEKAERAFSEQLAISDDLSGLAVLMHAAFVIAAQRKFAPPWSRAEIIRFVAQVRTLLSERHGLLDPLTAEDELRSALGERVTATHEVGTVAAASTEGDHPGDTVRAPACKPITNRLLHHAHLVVTVGDSPRPSPERG